MCDGKGPEAHTVFLRRRYGAALWLPITVALACHPGDSQLREQVKLQAEVDRKGIHHWNQRRGVQGKRRDVTE